MTKPNGPQCNLNCGYCFYLEKNELYADSKRFAMSDGVLEHYVSGFIASQAALGLREIWFNWQGGEPALSGLAFYRKVVALQMRYAPDHVTIQNAFQTNGTLLDDDWTRFFAEHRFLIGLSIDGPEPIHDAYRVDRAKRPSFKRVMEAAERLARHEVAVNALTVVHQGNVRRPREVYRFLKDAGFRHLQFIPAVEEAASLALPSHRTAKNLAKWSASPKAYGRFLCAIFDDWATNDIGEVSVQMFDVHMGTMIGMPSWLCTFAPTCGQALAMEHNGDLYSCDHFVYPTHLLGNILETPLDALATSAPQVRFGENKQTGLPTDCRICSFVSACNGGCPKHRFMPDRDGGYALNYFCPSFKMFFKHAGARLRTIAMLQAQGASAPQIRELLRRQPNKTKG
ncbi:anaerobic sulfatase maturase [Pseudovibrio exalbescens]|uniref:anaerobic sulfatase maturase n=1 Tax=Pseudovibrio exalbescens TaxID=197461 RepID=UPI0023673343|nr:anaerobic sulfatase maturase [Pseudovibrio exalbescens]MDD7910011.1 anaerobic sulfatase maturase [Pseudovibrio exalbescens]